MTLTARWRFWWAIAAVIAAMVSIQSGASLAKSLFPAVGPTGTTALRLIFASLVLVTLWRPWRRPIPAATWRAVALYGVSLGVMNLLFYMALARIPLGVAVAIEFTGPLAIALWSSRRALDFLWVACAVAGILLLFPLTHAASQLDPQGVLLALGAGVCWALYIVFGKRLGTTVHGGTATTLGMLFAAAVAVPVGFIHVGWRLLEPRYVPIGLAIGVMSSALPYSLEMLALATIPTPTFGILMSVEPAIAAVSGLLFLGERLAPLQWVAIALVIVASAGSGWSSRQPEAKEPACPSATA